MIPILPIRTSACFVLWLMAFVLFCVASAFFDCLDIRYSPSVKIEHVRSPLGCPVFFTPCLVRFYAYVKAH